MNETDDGKLGRSDEELVRIDGSRSYVVRDAIIIVITEFAQSTDVRVCRSSTVSLASVLVDNFKESTKKTFLAFLREVAAD